MKFNCLLVGESGAGKTPLAATLAECKETAPCLFLDVDRGSLSIISNPRPTIFEINSWDQVRQIYVMLRDRKWVELAELTNSEPQEYLSLVIDSGTELEYVLRKSVVVANEHGDKEVPSQPDYLKTQERFRSLYRALRDLPLSVVMTAGIRDLKDDVVGMVKFFPAFQPGLTRDLVRMTDLVLFMDVRMEEKKWIRCLQTHASQRIIARDRSQKLDPVIKGDKMYFKDIVARMMK